MSLDLAELSAESVRLAASAGGQSGGLGGFLDNFTKMPETNGYVQGRLLPPVEVDGRQVFYQATRVHKINGRNVQCRRELIKQADGSYKWLGECAICDYYSWLWKQCDTLKKENKIDASEDKKALARSIRPAERYYYNFLIQESYGVKAPAQTPADLAKILSVGVQLHDKIIKGITGDKTMGKKPLGDVTDIKRGRDFKVARKMKSNAPDAFPEYDGSGFVEEVSPLGDADTVKKILDSRHNLTDLRKIPTVDDAEYEVKVHMGYVADTKVRVGGFDPEAKWGKANLVAPHVSEAAAAVAAPVGDTKPEPAPFAVEDVGSDTAMDMDDFEAELDALGGR